MHRDEFETALTHALHAAIGGTGITAECEKCREITDAIMPTIASGVAAMIEQRCFDDDDDDASDCARVITAALGGGE